MTTEFHFPVRTSGTAVLALVLGLPPVSFITLGLPAIFLGFYALRGINQSDGRLRGRRLAIAAMILGALNLLIVLLWALVPAVRYLRAVNDKTTCQNHLRKIGLAMSQYYDEHKVYPAGTIPNADLRPEQRLSWLAALLHYLPPEAGRGGSRPAQVYDAIDRTAAWDAPVNQDAVNTPFRTFLCPSAPDLDLNHRPALTTYVGTAGIGPNAAELPVENPRAGVFGYDRRITRDNVPAGLATTVMATETTLDNGPWAAGGRATVRGLDPEQKPYFGDGRQFGGCHPGGLNVLFLDGHVDFLRDSIQPKVFEALLTLAAD